MIPFIKTVKALMSLKNRDKEDYDSYRTVVATLRTRAVAKPLRECSEVECLAYDVYTTLMTEDNGWVKESKVCFARDELYDMFEAGLIHEPCRGEGGYVYFKFTDE